MNEKYKNNFLKAGALAKEVRHYGKSLIQKGASYNDVMQKIQAKIKELDAKPAFPPQIALNHVAAHYLPFPEEDILFQDQVIKLDVGICYNGAIGDCAVSVDLSGKFQPLIDAVEEALLNAEKILKVGLPLGEIGKTIEETIARHGFSAVKNLSGHGLGYYKIHTDPRIPNYDDGSRQTLKPGMTFAIEPFATDGKGLIQEKGIPMIFSLVALRSVKSSTARALLKKIRSFNGLPFSIHQFVGEFTLDEIKEGIGELLDCHVIEGYPPLVEDLNRMVVQAENSVLIDDSGAVFVTTR